jgi:hypothetical protein
MPSIPHLQRGCDRGLSTTQKRGTCRSQLELEHAQGRLFLIIIRLFLSPAMAMMDGSRVNGME